MTAMVATTSCTSEEEVMVNESKAEKAITFNASVPMSRATVTTINNLKEFGVDAYLIQGDQTIKWIDADKVTKTDGVWSTKEEYLWPHSGEMTFFSVHPSDVKVTYPSSKNFKETRPKFTYKANSNAELEKDLIYATSVKNCASAYGTAANATSVDINFRHALSQVVFKAKNNKTDKWEIDIDNVKIQNIYSEGTYTLPVSSTAANNTVRGSWSLTKSLNDYITHFNPVLNIGSEPVTLTSANNGAFLLIPQVREAWDRENDRTCEKQGAYFLVNCKIRQINADGSKTLLWPSAEKDAYAEVAIPVDINWEEGKQYVYTFIFGPGAGFNPPHQTDGGDPVVPGDPTLAKIGFNVTVIDFNSPATNTDVKM